MRRWYDLNYKSIRQRHTYKGRKIISRERRERREKRDGGERREYNRGRRGWREYL